MEKRKGRATSAAMHPVRHYLADRDGWVCRYCGTAVECPTCERGTTRAATLDHIHPRALGGTNAIPNLCLACGPCNERKAHHPVDRML